MSESSLAGRAAVLGFVAFILGPFWLAMLPLTAHPPNWILTNLVPHGETEPVGLIESFGAPPQTPGRLRPGYTTGMWAWPESSWSGQ
ncbi:MAG: hypothetical protein GY696_29210 [Gammaproteobacteria bacterium]|nr:hypothetical protein [Gammaproteobacteria bacterium]